MRAEPALNIDTPPPEPPGPSVAETPPAAEEAKPKKPPSEQRIKKRISEILKEGDREAIEAQIEELEQIPARSARQEANLKKLVARLALIERLEEQYAAARRAARAKSQLGELMEAEKEDHSVLERLRKNIDETAAKKNAAIAERLKKIKQQREAEAAVKAASADARDAAMEAVDALKKEIGVLSDHIEEYQEALSTYEEEMREVKREMTRRKPKREALEGSHQEHLGSVLAVGALAAGVETEKMTAEKAYQEEVEKEEQAREEAARERAVAIEEAERRRANEPKPVKEQLKGVGKGALKVAGVGGLAIAGVGLFGGFGLVGNFFKTWARRIAHPHRFADDLYKHLQKETAEPPKGKGALLGTVGTIFWFLGGDAPLIPHDTYHVPHGED